MKFVLESIVLADDPTPVPTDDSAAPVGTGGGWVMYLVIGVLIILMVVMQRRSKKKQEAQVDFRRTLEPGQRVMTLGGLVGLITAVEGDVITIRSQGGDSTSWVRRAIRNVVPEDEWEAMLADYPADPDEVEELEDGEGETPLEIEDSVSEADDDAEYDAVGEDEDDAVGQDEDDETTDTADPDAQDDESGTDAR